MDIYTFAFFNSCNLRIQRVELWIYRLRTHGEKSAADFQFYYI